MAANLRMRNLLFVMTPGMTLSAWKDNGSFEREIAVYRSYAKRGWKVKILSFGREKYDFAGLHKNIEVVSARHNTVFTHLIAFTHKSYFQWADVIKTNQSYCSWVFVFAAKLAQRPILLRSGYVYGEYLETVNGMTLWTRLYQMLEGWAFRNATLCAVTTQSLADWSRAKYGLTPAKVIIIPNYIDTDIFRPLHRPKIENSVISVGRLSPVKRYDLLIKGCAKIPGTKLTIVGEGDERPRLTALAQKLGVSLEMPGNVPNSALPAILGSHQVFALTSLREGHPKALIEAMACGLACVGSFYGQENFADSILIARPEEESIRHAIAGLFQNKESREKYSNSAFRFATEEYAFPRIFAMEAGLLEKIGHD